MEKSGSELALQSTLKKNFENFRLLKIVEWGRLIAQNDPLAMLILKIYKIIILLIYKIIYKFGGHIMAPESREGTQ